MSAKSSRLRDGVIFRKDPKLEIAKRELRIKRISSLKASAFSTYRITDYRNEAEDSFVNGCFRSCIFSSAVAVELALKNALIFQSDDWEKTYWEIEMKKLRFSDVIKRLSKNSALGDCLKKADWLRQARNEITAHPLFIGNPFKETRPGYLESLEFEQEIWASRTMVRDIKNLLRFVEPQKKKEIEERKFSEVDSQKVTLKEFSVKEFIELKRSIRYESADFLYWRIVQNELIEEIAFLAYRKMVEAINTLFPSASEPAQEKKKEG